ncbi:MAG TPA: dihydroorotase [Bdellovibrionota bacterium]|jgi:dihydroorotase
MNSRTAPSSLYVTGAHLVDPSQKWNGPADLLIERGVVAAVDKPGKLKAKAKTVKADTVDGDGLHMAPGFVDLNCRVHEPGAEHIENFESASQAAAAGGFTTILAQPFTEPVHDNAFMTDFILRRAKEHSHVRVVPMGALSHGREGKKLAEIGGMAAAGARAVGDSAAVENSYLMRKALEYARAFQLPIFSFPEDRNLAGQGVMNEGWNSNRLGLRGIPPAAEEIIVARDLVLLRHTRSRLHFQSISTAGSLRAIRLAKEDGLVVTAETNPAYFSLTSDSIATYDANFKCFPPLRSEEDKEALAAALADGTLDCIASAHSPQTRSSKEQTFEYATPGMIALETTLALTLELVRAKKLSPSRMVELLSLNPARILGLEDKVGGLREGCQADFVLFDPKASFVFESERVRSAARNSPFLGRKLQGSVKATYVNGTAVYGARKEKK